MSYLYTARINPLISHVMFIGLGALSGASLWGAYIRYGFNLKQLKVKDEAAEVWRRKYESAKRRKQQKSEELKKIKQELIKAERQHPPVSQSQLFRQFLPISFMLYYFTFRVVSWIVSTMKR